MKSLFLLVVVFLSISPRLSRAEEAAAKPLPAGAGEPASPAPPAMPPPAPTPGSTVWGLDADHSEVGFLVRHMMVSNVRGAFHTVVGSWQWNDKDVTKSTLDVTIGAASVDTRVQKRDDHLRSPDFLDAAKYPNITFKSTKVKKKRGGLTITGELTIRDVTKSVTLDVKGPSPIVKDPFGLTRSAVSATTKIKRSDFGLKWNAAVESGGVVVGDEVSIEINAEFVKKG